MKILFRIWKLFVCWGRPPEQPRPGDLIELTFTREHDGLQMPVTACACADCKNHWLVFHAEFELPSFCPYCGKKFTGLEKHTPEEMERFQIL